MEIKPNEVLTRYIFARSHFGGGRVKYGAFIPDSALELSVFRVSELNDDEIWKLGVEYVQGNRKERLKARADLTASVVYDLGLKAIPETSPHPLHANITQWPPTKHQRQLLAVKLAERAKLAVKT